MNDNETEIEYDHHNHIICRYKSFFPVLKFRKRVVNFPT